MNKIKKIFFLSLIIVLSGCSPKNNNEEPPQVQEEEHIIMYVDAINGLRVRDTPNQDGERIGLLEDLTEVTVKEEAEIEIELGGVTGRWTLVATDDLEGWVFGGFLSSEKPDRSEIAEAADEINNQYINFDKIERIYLGDEFDEEPKVYKLNNEELTQLRRLLRTNEWEIGSDLPEITGFTSGFYIIEEEQAWLFTRFGRDTLIVPYVPDQNDEEIYYFGPLAVINETVSFFNTLTPIVEEEIVETPVPQSDPFEIVREAARQNFDQAYSVFVGRIGQMNADLFPQNHFVWHNPAETLIYTSRIINFSGTYWGLSSSPISFNKEMQIRFRDGNIVNAQWRYVYASADPWFEIGDTTRNSIRSEWFSTAVGDNNVSGSGIDGVINTLIHFRRLRVGDSYTFRRGSGSEAFLTVESLEPIRVQMQDILY